MALVPARIDLGIAARAQERQLDCSSARSHFGAYTVRVPRRG
jgi:hypothetical protein